MADEIVACGEQQRAQRGEDETARTQVLRPALRDERDPAADDRNGADDERRGHRLAQHDERNRDRHERRGAHDDGRPRRTDATNREREQELRHPRREQPRERVRPGVQDVVRPRDERGDYGDGECDGDGRRSGDRSVGLAREAHPHRDGHPSEERRGGERERDGGQAGLRTRTRRASVPAAAGSATAIPRQDHGAARPADRAEAIAREREAEDAREDGLQREDERRARGARPLLSPRLHEVTESARKDARHDQRAPDRPTTRQLDLTRSDGNHCEADERSDHLRSRERERIEARRKPLHQHDLQRVQRRSGEDQQIARQPIRPPRRTASPVR